jgi:hypothetical protein
MNRHYEDNFTAIGSLEAHASSASVEVRISWTPQTPDIAADFLVFEKMMYATVYCKT